MRQKQVFIFTHIPKTGGTTLRIHFQKHLKDQYDFIHLANKGHKWAKEQGLKPFYERPKEIRQQAKVILGHQVNCKTKELVPDLKPIEIVTFRNPMDWEKSRFNQFVNRRLNEGKNKLSFKQWTQEVEKMHSQFDWFLSYYLGMGGEINQLPKKEKEVLLFKTLSSFSKVALLDRFDDYFIPIFNQLNIPTTAKKQNVVGIEKKQLFINSQENQELLENICGYDLSIFNKIKNIYKI